MMLLAIALLLIGWWCRRYARTLEQAVAHDLPTPSMQLVIEVYGGTRDRVVRDGLAGQNGGCNGGRPWTARGRGRGPKKIH